MVIKIVKFDKSLSNPKTVEKNLTGELWTNVSLPVSGVRDGGLW